MRSITPEFTDSSHNTEKHNEVLQNNKIRHQCRVG